MLLANCVRYAANPWRYFQLNAPWFNNEKKIFSKLDIDQSIPQRWRIPQEPLNANRVPSSFPVFLKPEWGQNSRGIVRVDSAEQWQQQLESLNEKFFYIVQQAAQGKEEFEIFYLRDPKNLDSYAQMSISRVKNIEKTAFPINSIRNPHTTYNHCTDAFNEAELQQLWSMLNELGQFKIARVCCRCDSRAALLEGNFEIVEINLFVPMPLVLMDPAVEQQEKTKFVRAMTRNLALLIKVIPKDQPYSGIFFSKWALHRKIVKWKE